MMTAFISVVAVLAVLAVVHFWLLIRTRRNGQDTAAKVNQIERSIQMVRRRSDLVSGRVEDICTILLTEREGGGRDQAALERHPSVEPPTRIVYGPLDSPDLEIRRFEGPANGPGLTKIDLPNRAMKQLEPLMRGVPGILAGTAMSASELYVLSFSPGVTAALRSGSLTLMQALGGGQRAIAVNAQGGFVEHAVLTPSTGVRAAGAALAVWQVLAIVTAQKFLSDIERRLAHIDRGIQDLKDWLEEDRRARLTANLAYLRMVENHLRQPDMTEADAQVFSHQLDTIERESLQAMEACRLQMGRIREEISHLQLGGGTGLEERKNSVMSRVDEHENVAYTFLVSAYVRGAAAQIRCALPISRTLAQARIMELRRQLDEHRQSDRAFHELVNRKAGQLKSRWAWASTEHEMQGELRRASRDRDKGHRRFQSELESMVRDGEALIANSIDEDSRPLELIAALDSDGHIVSVQSRA